MRFTTKLGEFYVSESGSNFQQTQKLGVLEDQEEKLKIPLETVFDALKNGINLKTLSGVKYYDKVVLCLYGEEPRLDIYAHGDIWASVLLKDHQITWWSANEEVK